MKLLYPALAITGAIALSFIAHNATAQIDGQVYQYDTSVKVTAYGQEKTLAWCGGFDNPQFAMADLNNDGLKDLVVYEVGTGLRTFINRGTAGNPKYVFAPEYEQNFPPVNSFLTLKDYNCDSIADLFTYGTIWKGYYNTANQLCFTYYKPLVPYVSPSDIPAIVDVDGDGDLDLLSFDLYAGHILLYKNLQKDSSMLCDSMSLKLKDKCWGRAYGNGSYSFYPTLNVFCDNSGLKTSGTEGTTSSGNTICAFDYDGDGDMDLLWGNRSYDSLVFLENGKAPSYPSDTMIRENKWQASGHTLYMPTWPAAFNVDIDQDGKKDILVSPHSKGENYKCIAYYKNTGTLHTPSYTYMGDTILVDKTIDMGSDAYPMFYDYNKDGKPDLFIGSEGLYQSNGTYRAQIAYYKNTSTSGHPSFTLVTNDFLNLSTYNFSGAAPAVGDIDNDGKADLLLGHPDGTITYFKNMASSAAIQPDWQLAQQYLKDASGDTINVLANATPFIYDIDKDAKPDLICGDYSGTIYYYQNTSTTPGTISLKKITDKLGGVQVDNRFSSQRNSTPFIGKIDNTGVDYLMVGSYSGRIYRYTGFQLGDTALTYTMLDSNYSYIDSTYLNINGTGNNWRFHSTPAIADVDGDGKYEMVVGDAWGGVQIYSQVKNVSVPTVQTSKDHSISVYPNPADNYVTITWKKGFANNNVTLTMVTTTGRKVLEKTVAGTTLQAQLLIGSMPAGVYYCIVQSDTQREVVPVTIVRQ